MRESLRFTWTKYVSYLAAPLFPLILVAFFTLFLIIFGFFQVVTVFVGDIFIAGLLWPLVILIGLVMAVILVGLVGWPLMYATISTEGSDSFDALSRSYSYVYQAPWNYLWYCFLGVAYGVVVVFFVGLMGSLMIYLGKWGVSQAPLTKVMDRDPAYLFVYAPTSFHWRDLMLEGTPAVYSEAEIKAISPADLKRINKNEKPKAKFTKGEQEDIRNKNYAIGKIKADYIDDFKIWNKIGAWLVTFWLGLMFLLIVGFGYSYFWSASTMIYLLMRKKVDDTELDEVHLDEEEDDAYMPPPAPATKPEGDGNLIPPESLTLRTPATPAPEAPKPETPATGSHEAPKTMLAEQPLPPPPEGGLTN